MKKILFLIAILVLLVGCTTSIKQIEDNPDKYIGEKVSVKGTVENTIKIGQLSGYTLRSEEGAKIGVSSKSLPEEGSEITVKGIVIKDTLFGVYILAE